MGLNIVLRHALAVKVHDTEVVLGDGVALLGQRAPFTQCRRIVASLGRFLSSLNVLRHHRRGECDDKGK